MRRRVLLGGVSVCLALLARGWADEVGTLARPTTLFVYNTVGDMLAGDMWDVTTRADVLREVRAGPLAAPLLGLGTTSEAFHNGELVVQGTVGMPLFYWCRPEYPEPVLPLGGEPLPFLALTRCDPAEEIRVPLTAGQPVHAQVAQLVAAREIPFAAVQVTGTFREVRGTVAYHLRKDGTPLTQPGLDTSVYQLPFTENPSRAWSFSGYYAGTADAQALVSVTGATVHLHGVRADLSHGGHLAAATAVSGRVRIFPIRRVVTHQSDLTVRYARYAGGNLRFVVANPGNNGVSYVPVRGRTGETSVFRILVSGLGPGQSREVVVPKTWTSDPAVPLVIEADPENDVRESDESNNTLSL